MKMLIANVAKYFTVVMMCVLLSFNSNAQTDEKIPAGDYTLDKSHTSLLFRVNHLGFSMFTARFVDYDAKVFFDPEALEKSKLNVTIKAKSIETDFPANESLDFNKMLHGIDWLNADKHPLITFVATQVKVTANNVTTNNVMEVTGDFTLRGITKPVTLHVTYNGGWAGFAADPAARIGFSAQGKFNRSDFGMSYGIPPPGTTMGVSDQVDIIIETELTGPPWRGAQ